LIVAGVERSDADAFFASRRAGCDDRISSTEAWLHEQLLDAAFDDTAQTICRRRLAISAAGVPVVYSHKCSPRSRASFRMLAEPGGTGVTVAEQVQLSRALINRVIDHLGWEDARVPANAILDVLLPPEPSFYTAWHGGIGLGLEVGDRGPELRVYVNVRHGDLRVRWQRLVDAVGEIADERAEPALREIVDIASPRAVPAGLALAIDGRGVTALRLYCGMTDASAGGVTAALPRLHAGAAPSITQFLRSYAECFGDPIGQDVTVAYDFVVLDGLLSPTASRYKADVFCEPVSGRHGDRLMAWLEAQLATRGLGGGVSELHRFLNDVEDAFGAFTLQYVSLGCSDRGDEVTVYCIPGDPTRWAE
jgi:hypothetical protein